MASKRADQKFEKLVQDLGQTKMSWHFGFLVQGERG